MTVLSLNRENFISLLGPLDQLMNRNMNDYKRNLRAKSGIQVKAAESRRATMEYSDLSNLIVLGLLGRGGYGLVKLVKDPVNGKTFALKEVRKDKIVESQQTKHIADERRIMMMLDSPFLVNLLSIYILSLSFCFFFDFCKRLIA